MGADNNLGASNGSLTFGGGTLQLDASFNLSPSRSMVLNSGGGTIDTQSFFTTISQDIGGIGNLTKAGTGTLTLSGANTYSGSTTISAGILDLSGSGSIATSSGVDDNGTFDISGSTSGASIQALSGDGDVTLGSQTLTINNTSADVYAGVMSGTGGLTKNGVGTLTLNGVNSFTGGTAVISGTLNVNGTVGAVSVASGGTLAGTGKVGTTSVASGGTLSPGANPGLGTLSIQGTLTLAPGSTTQDYITPTASSNASVTRAANINGSLVASAGSGTYTIGQRYTLVGAAGGLNGTYASLTTLGLPSYVVGRLGYDADDVYFYLDSSPILNVTSVTVNLTGTSSTFASLTGTGGILNIAPGDILTVTGGNFGGTITGGGSLTIAGTDTLVLTGNNTLANTNISNGTLEVDGTLTSPVIVGSGATLGGSGTIVGTVSVGSGGTYSPGDPVTSAVIGAVAFQKGSTYLAQQTTTASDLIAVTGSLTIQPGAALVAEPLGNPTSYSRVTNYTIITATQGVAGTFSSASSTVATLSPYVSYSADSVTLTLVRNDISLTTLASTPNQTGVAAAINAAGPSSAIYGAVAPNSDALVKQMFDPLSGEIYASLRTALVADDRLIRDSVLDHLAGNPSDRTVAWGSSFAGSGNIDGNGNSANLSHTDTGLIAGVDMPVFDGIRAGIAVAWTGQKLAIPTAPAPPMARAAMSLPMPVMPRTP